MKEREKERKSYAHVKMHISLLLSANYSLVYFILKMYF